ncbi:MAG: indole-3-glycerol phosphate synthase TrpC [Bacteroidota bacterium]
MTILDKITAYKTLEVNARKKAIPVSLFKEHAHFERTCLSFSQALRDSKTGIIAEHKRRSPSKAVINDRSALPDVVQGYEKAGASALSVLTDTRFFGGSLDDLLLARDLVSIPILRKEFIVDPYQIYEAKAYGADAILLIAACLSTGQLQEFTAVARSLGLEVLLEVHNETELERSLNTGAHLLGVNNRNLKTFEVSIETSKKLAALIPDSLVSVSESGISTIQAIEALRHFGYKGFLIGEHFMKTTDPGESATNFIADLS